MMHVHVVTEMTSELAEHAIAQITDEMLLPECAGRDLFIPIRKEGGQIVTHVRFRRLPCRRELGYPPMCRAAIVGKVVQNEKNG